MVSNYYNAYSLNLQKLTRFTVLLFFAEQSTTKINNQPKNKKNLPVHHLAKHLRSRTYPPRILVRVHAGAAFSSSILVKNCCCCCSHCVCCQTEKLNYIHIPHRVQCFYHVTVNFSLLASELMGSEQVNLL